ncbi:hypothetical protein [Nocardiopsis alba]|uniref:Uncharacterized protein n=1 Tax=Nocardiopsis alba TaxID=53437 RepID=A0ABV5DZW0_9ACTN|nr:hypothetical protein [Nocardiopsis alba]
MAEETTIPHRVFGTLLCGAVLAIPGALIGGPLWGAIPAVTAVVVAAVAATARPRNGRGATLELRGGPLDGLRLDGRECGPLTRAGYLDLPHHGGSVRYTSDGEGGLRHVA